MRNRRSYGLPRKFSYSTVGYVGPDLPHGGYDLATQHSSFGGNSGSGIFAVGSGELVGVLTNGGDDWVREAQPPHAPATQLGGTDGLKA